MTGGGGGNGMNGNGDADGTGSTEAGIVADAATGKDSAAEDSKALDSKAPAPDLAPGSCFANADCAGDQHCSFYPKYHCTPTSPICVKGGYDVSCDAQVGTCVARPRDTTCSKNILRVCGCDGVTYDNACWMFVAGVSLAFEDKCDAIKK